MDTRMRYRAPLAGRTEGSVWDLEYRPVGARSRGCRDRGDQGPHPVWAPGMFCPDWDYMALIPGAEEMGSSNNSTAESPHMETGGVCCFLGAPAPRGVQWEGAGPKQLSYPCQANGPAGPTSLPSSLSILFCVIPRSGRLPGGGGQL